MFWRLGDKRFQEGVIRHVRRDTRLNILAGLGNVAPLMALTIWDIWDNWGPVRGWSRTRGNQEGRRCRQPSKGSREMSQ